MKIFEFILVAITTIMMSIIWILFKLMKIITAIVEFAFIVFIFLGSVGLAIHVEKTYGIHLMGYCIIAAVITFVAVMILCFWKPEKFDSLTKKWLNKM